LLDGIRRILCLFLPVRTRTRTPIDTSFRTRTHGLSGFLDVDLLLLALLSLDLIFASVFLLDRFLSSCSPFPFPFNCALSKCYSVFSAIGGKEGCSGLARLPRRVSSAATDFHHVSLGVGVDVDLPSSFNRNPFPASISAFYNQDTDLQPEPPSETETPLLALRVAPRWTGSLSQSQLQPYSVSEFEGGETDE